MENRSNIVSMNAKAPGKLPCVSQHDWRERLRPADTSTAIAVLSTCLTLVRPVGMTQGESEDWLSVAVGEVRHLPGDILNDACRKARMTCTHHAQIVPAILNAAKEPLDHRRDMVSRPVIKDFLPSPDGFAPEPGRQMTQADVDTLMPALQRIGLQAGWLVQDADGNVTLADD